MNIFFVFFFLIFKVAASDLPICSADFLSPGGKCDSNEGPIIQYADGVEFTRAYYRTTPESAPLYDHYWVEPTLSEKDLGLKLFDVIKKILIEKIRDGRALASLPPVELHLVRRIENVSLGIRSIGESVCITGKRPHRDESYNDLRHRVDICPTTLKLSPLQLAFLFGHEIGHSIDDCSGTMPLYRWKATTADGKKGELYSGKVATLNRSENYRKLGKLEVVAEIPKGLSEVKNVFMEMQQCVAIAKAGPLYASRINQAELCKKHVAFEDIADYIGFTAALQYMQIKKYPTRFGPQIFGILRSQACNYKDDVVKFPIERSHSPDVTRLNTGFQVKGMRDVLNCQGTSGFTINCFEKPWPRATDNNPFATKPSTH